MNLDWLQTFYIVGALFLVAMAIVAYPTLKNGPKRKASKR